ncbi:MAG: GNAT family N-acetyltransferase [Crocinitomicaceae bacterium]
MNFKEIAYKSEEWTKAVQLREKVLREPLGSKFTDQELEEEKSHIQIAGFLDNELVATVVLVPDGENIKMQRVVVIDSLRNKNIGSEMMIFCEKLAVDRNFRLIYCHARDTAVNFYYKNHYEKDGDYFDEDGIPHLKMKKKL